MNKDIFQSQDSDIIKEMLTFPAEFSKHDLDGRVKYTKTGFARICNAFRDNEFLEVRGVRYRLLCHDFQRLCWAIDATKTAAPLDLDATDAQTYCATIAKKGKRWEDTLHLIFTKICCQNHLRLKSQYTIRRKDGALRPDFIITSMDSCDEDFPTKAEPRKRGEPSLTLFVEVKNVKDPALFLEENIMQLEEYCRTRPNSVGLLIYRTRKIIETFPKISGLIKIMQFPVEYDGEYDAIQDQLVEKIRKLKMDKKWD